jgi:hypothetical protein
MHRCCCRSGCKKDFGKQWSAFGGGGCTFNEVRAADSCQAGTVVTYQVLPRLQIGGRALPSNRGWCDLVSAPLPFVACRAAATFA